MTGEVIGMNEKAYMDINLLHGDCLELMKDIPDKSIDMILCDLPYGTTHAKWDSVIPLDLLWVEYARVIKDNGSIILFGQNPFSSILVCSNLKLFNHSWVWEKDKCANFQLAKHQPRKMTEDILVFSKGGYTYNAKNKCIYNPQMIDREPRKPTGLTKRSEKMVEINPRPNPTLFKSGEDFIADKSYPKNLVYFPTEHKGRLHPTQKPVALFEYLIKTYTNEGETVLDNCMGSGTTGVACLNTNRNFIGIELDDKYFEIAKRRIND